MFIDPNEHIADTLMFQAVPVVELLVVAVCGSLIYSFIIPTMIIALALHALPLAMIVTAFVAKSRGRRPLSMSVAGSVLYVSFVVPWIGMMLSLFQRRQWRWVWRLAYILTFLNHFWICLDLYLWHYVVGGVSYGKDPILGFPFLRAGDPPSVLFAIEIFELFFLLIGTLIVLYRLAQHKSEKYYHGDDYRHPEQPYRRDETLICWRCVEPLVFFGLWQVHVIILSFFHNLLVSESLIDLLNWLFNPERPIWGGYLQYAAALAYIVVFAWLLFLAGYGISVLGQRLVRQLKKRDDGGG